MLESEKPSSHYEGLNQIAADLWRSWLKLYEDNFYGFQYNVRVGQGIQPPAGATEAAARQWKMNTQKRIDVVAQRQGQTWIIEIDERPGLAHLGQVIGYIHLAQTYLPLQGFVQGAVISRTMGYDMSQILRAQNIMYFVFPGTSPPRLPPTFLPTSGRGNYAVQP